MTTKDLLFELGCEELPPTTLTTLRDHLLSALCAGLEEEEAPKKGKRKKGTNRCVVKRVCVTRRKTDWSMSVDRVTLSPINV